MNIGILASGGDGAGMNYCLYNIYKKIYRNNNVFLFNRGYMGLINNDILNYDFKYIKNHKNDGGIMIKTSRCPQFQTPDGLEKGIKNLSKNNIDVLIVMGGNGSLKGAKELLKQNINIMFIPCTIDNDVLNSEYCIGFDTACNNCANFIKQVNDTMKSFNRTCIYEAMGRKCPSIAITVGNMVNADYLYVSNNCSVDSCVETLRKTIKTKDAPIVILRENLIDIKYLKQEIEKKLDLDVRTCIVGYFQRGGMPTKIEKLYAKKFASMCVNEIKNKKFNKSIIVKNGVFVAEKLN